MSMYYHFWSWGSC